MRRLLIDRLTISSSETSVIDTSSIMKRKETSETPYSSLDSAKKHRVSQENPKSFTEIETQSPSMTQVPKISAANDSTLSHVMSVEDKFPYFQAGNVHILLSPGETPDYQLHGQILEQHSPWFKQELAKNDYKDRKYLFYLDQDVHSDVPLLYQKVR